MPMSIRRYLIDYAQPRYQTQPASPPSDNTTMYDKKHTYLSSVIPTLMVFMAALSVPYQSINSQSTFERIPQDQRMKCVVDEFPLLGLKGLRLLKALIVHAFQPRDTWYTYYTSKRTTTLIDVIENVT
ncbi:hypothetical protein BX600DRAFT_442025 [Xylariales sp. PMI_506]|nr:hypothetical protein BX600DRAFT_442025 [Xylariales sp. PMI_506]